MNELIKVVMETDSKQVALLAAKAHVKLCYWMNTETAKELGHFLMFADEYELVEAVSPAFKRCTDKWVAATILAELAIETKGDNVVVDAVDMLLKLDSDRELLFDVMCKANAFWYRLSDVIDRYGQEFLDRAKQAIEEEEHPVERMTMLTHLASVAWNTPIAMDTLGSLLDNMPKYKFSAIFDLVNCQRNGERPVSSTVKYLKNARSYIDDEELLDMINCKLALFDEECMEIVKESSGSRMLCTTLMYLVEEQMSMTTVEEIIVNALLDKQKKTALLIAIERLQLKLTPQIMNVLKQTIDINDEREFLLTVSVLGQYEEGEEFLFRYIDDIRSMPIEAQILYYSYLAQ